MREFVPGVTVEEYGQRWQARGQRMVARRRTAGGAEPDVTPDPDDTATVDRVECDASIHGLVRLVAAVTPDGDGLAWQHWSDEGPREPVTGYAEQVLDRAYLEGRVRREPNGVVLIVPPAQP